MADTFRISVVIPVFNAEKFIRRAIESAITQPEVAEVVIVDDGSADDSVKIVDEIAATSAVRINVVTHPGHANRGAGASRNLGIECASHEWIAFLDADDYFLPNRFAVDREAIESDPTLDGVYDALGLDLKDDIDGWWKKSGGYCGLVTLMQRIPPEELFLRMGPVGISGSFSTDAIVVNKRIFKKTGCAFGSLRFGEDTLLWMQMAAAGRLAPGCIDKPVSMRGVHGANSIRENIDHRITIAKVFEAFRAWDGFSNLSPEQSKAFFRAQIHLARDWSGVLSAMRGTSGWFSASVWKAVARWAIVRQFPEDPFIPGFFPSLRRH